MPVHQYYENGKLMSRARFLGFACFSYRLNYKSKNMEGECLATKAIMEKGAKVGYMFREKPDYPNDTGWRIFTGAETLDFVDAEDNIEVYDIAEIIKKDPAIEHYLDSSINTEWEREVDGDKFLATKTQE